MASLLVFAMVLSLGQGLFGRVLISAAKAASARKQSVVVFDFANKSKGGPGLAHTFTNQVRLVIAESSPAFDLVSFSTTQPYGPSIERAIRESRLKPEDLTPADDADLDTRRDLAIKVARVLGADLALVGEIDEDGYVYDEPNKKLTLKVTGYLYDATTAELKMTASGTGTAEGGTIGVLEEKARTMAAKDLHARLAGIPQKTESDNQHKPKHKVSPWLIAIPAVLVGVLLFSLLGGKKSSPGPSAPGALTVTPLATGVRLSWAPSADASVTSYRIYRAAVTRSQASSRGRDSQAFTLIATVPSTQVQYDDTPPAVAGVLYSYVVAPVSGDKQGTPITGDRTAAPGLPSSVTGLRAVVDHRTVQLTWNANTETFITGYNIYRSDQMSTGFTKVGQVTGTGTSYTDTGLAGGQTYFYKVTAVGTNSQESDLTSVSAVPATSDLQPSAPTGVTATASVGQRQIVISWTANPEPDVQYYQVYRGYKRTRASVSPVPNIWNKFPSKLGTRGGPYQLLADRVTTTSVTDTNVDFNNVYYYVVRAVSAQGESPYSEEASASPNKAPAAVQVVTFQAGDGSVTLKWSPVAEPDIQGYYVYRQAVDPTATTTTTPTKVKITDLPVTDVQYVDSQVTNDLQYTYWVTAVDTAGLESPLSLPAGPAIPTAAPMAPANVLATAGSGKVTLVWNKNQEANLKEYRVYRSDSASLAPLFINTVPKADTTTITFTDSTAQNQVTYYYEVSAVNTSGVESAHSKQVTATPGDPPAAPENVQVLASDHAVTITWNPVTHYASSVDKPLPAYLLKGYRVYRTVVTTGVRTLVKELALSSLQSPTYTDSQMPLNTQLQYSVTALMPDSSGGVLESDPGVPADTSPVIVMHRLQAPTNLAATVTQNGAQIVANLTWDASTDSSALGYVIYGAATAAGPFTRLFPATTTSGAPTVPVTTTTKAITSDDWTLLRTAAVAYFRIATVDKLGVEGYQSDPPLLVNLLPPPQNLQATNSDALGNALDLEIDLSWLPPVQAGDQPLNITGYHVYRGQSANGPWQLITPTPLAPQISMSYRDLFADGSIQLSDAIGRDFYYQVAAVVGMPDGSTAESRVAATQSPVRAVDVPPGQVQGVTVAGANGVVTIKWQAVRDPLGNPLRDLTRYTVFRKEKTDLTGATQVQFNVAPGVQTYQDTDTLTTGVTYQYWVAAYDYSNKGPDSDIKEYTP